MNKKQLICMWLGIAGIVWVGFWNTPFASNDTDWDSFWLWTILFSLITGGLIITFRNKKGKAD